MDNWTIKAVFEPEVLLRASMQKVLLITDTKEIKVLMRMIFLLKLPSCLLKNRKVAASPRAAQIKSIENAGRKLSSILDHMYEEPQKIAFNSKKN